MPWNAISSELVWLTLFHLNISSRNLCNHSAGSAWKPHILKWRFMHFTNKSVMTNSKCQLKIIQTYWQQIVPISIASMLLFSNNSQNLGRWRGVGGGGEWGTNVLIIPYSILPYMCPSIRKKLFLFNNILKHIIYILKTLH